MPAAEPANTNKYLIYQALDVAVTSFKINMSLMQTIHTPTEDQQRTPLPRRGAPHTLGTSGIYNQYVSIYWKQGSEKNIWTKEEWGDSIMEEVAQWGAS
jgi:hypothetical protein